MRIQNDFREFLRLLKAHDVDFVILGGYAVAFHGYVRNTQDLDILFRADERGVGGLMMALRDFGFPEGTISAAEIARPGNVMRMGVPPVRIELLNRVSGVTFDEVWAGRVAGRYDDVPIAMVCGPRYEGPHHQRVRTRFLFSRQDAKTPRLGLPCLQAWRVVSYLSGLSGSYLLIDSAYSPSSFAPLRLGEIIIFISSNAYIGRAELLRNKAAAGRAKDLADIEELSRPPALSGRHRRRP